MSRKGLDKINTEIEDHEGVPVLKLSGSFSGEVAYEVLDVVSNKLFQKDKYSFILDMTDLQKFLSRGVAVIIEMSSIVSEKEGNLVIVCDKEEFRIVLEECDIERLARISDNLENALEIIRK